MTDLPSFPSLSIFGDSGDRLFELQGMGELAQMQVHTWSLREALFRTWQLQISALSLNAGIDPTALLGKGLTLLTRLADGRSTVSRSGVVLHAAAVSSDGAMARYNLSVGPWLSLLSYGRHSAVWQERSVIEIIDDVFDRYRSQAAWRWSACALAHLADSHQGGLRSYCVQYRETDLQFVRRILAHEGLVFRFEQDEAAPLGHSLVILANTSTTESCPEDATSAADGGIRFHRAAEQEEQDSIQSFNETQLWQATKYAVQTWDYKSKRSIVAHEISDLDAKLSAKAPRVEHFDTPVDYQYADEADAQRGLARLRQADATLQQIWTGRSTVRSFECGRQFTLRNSPLDVLRTPGNAPQKFLLTHVLHVGINKLPGDAADAARAAAQATASLVGQAPWIPAEVLAQAQATGYGNTFKSITADRPFKTPLLSDDGRELHPLPRPGGPLTATVVGPDGSTNGQGAEEIHTDRLGRIRVQFDFQRPEASGDYSGAATNANTSSKTSQASTWVRVLQRQAGAGMGWHFIPRVGMELAVDFMDGRIDHPVVIGALYNGQGEAGVRPTTGGAEPTAANDSEALAQSSDHRPSGQGNRIGRGHSPAWHGAGGASLSTGGQANTSALNGVKTQEFGGYGYNQLVFDDSPGQLRVQMATTQASTQLNLGHLIHQADNHRGSLRGAGFELRTDAYGAIRAGSGVLITTQGQSGIGSTQAGQATAEPAFDHAAGAALAAQLKTLGQSLGQMANVHQTTPLAGREGSIGANQSVLAGDTKPEAPLAAWHTSVKGMADALNFSQAKSDAAAKTTSTGKDKLPASTDPIIALHGRAGWAEVAGADMHLGSAEDITLASGQNSHWSTGGAYRLHTGQAIGILAGATEPGTEAVGTGLTMISAQGDTVLQAQSNTLQLAAKEQLSIQSQNAHIDFAAAKKIIIATEGGASITIEGGNITFACPGTITVQASAKKFEGSSNVRYDLPMMPTGGAFQRKYRLLRQSDEQPIPGQKYRITMDDGQVIEGVTDVQGATALSEGKALQATQIELLND